MTKLSLHLLFCFVILAGALETFSAGQKKSKPHRNTAALTEPASSQEKLRQESIRQAAFGDPFNEDKVKAYMESLPKADDLYVVEGDLLLTEQELRAYVVGKSQAQVPTIESGELLVNIHNGSRDYYPNVAQRNLTYAVDRNSFSSQAQYQTVVNNVRLAGQKWQGVCPTCRVRFTYLSQYDNSPTHDKVNFIVRLIDVRGAYIAAAFFPHEGPVRRYLNVDPSYFTTSFNKVGVFRHELGHVLGYRHEHTRNIPGCFFEDNQWQPLTPYDPKSVMHYFCGGAGSLNLDITALDRAGHRTLYRLP